MSSNLGYLSRYALTIAILLLASTFSFAASPGAKLVAQPDAITLRGASAEHGILVTLIEADGRTVDVTTKAHFSSSAASVVSVSSDATCRATGDGDAEITADYDGLSATVKVNVADFATHTPPSFRQDVVPVLTKAGCNAGSCHGKLAGQNGFRLSLRGYAPEWDYDSLTGELNSRRIDFAEPEKSLLLRKPLGAVPHEGGRRFSEDSREAKLLLEWIKARAPGCDPAENDAASLEILPGNRTLRVGDTQQLLVRGHWPDGRVRDVTWMCQFFSNDPSIVSVSEAGVVKSLRSGETAVRVHFQGLVEVVSITTPYDYQVNPKLFAEKNNVIDGHVFDRLSSLHIPPASLCDDATFIRRAFLDTIGTLPTPAEVRDFLADTQGDKRARLADSLLARPEFADYWTLQFCDLLQNRRERDHDVRGAKGTRSFHEWLREQMAANRPWNALAKDILTARGDAVHEPQIGYFIVLMGEKQNVEESDVTDSVAQAFLGIRIGCARCHNHPLEKYTQDDYYHFAAFFSGATLRRVDIGKGVTRLLPVNREAAETLKAMDASAKKVADAEDALLKASPSEQKKAEDALGELLKQEQQLCSSLAENEKRPPRVNQPRTNKPMDAQPLDRSAADLQAGVDPRIALAEWVTDPKNNYFSDAMVNRLWKHFMGMGLVEPVDDLRSSNPPSNPALMKEMREQFVSHGYDLKYMMRLILTSRTYQLNSATTPENAQDRRNFSHYYARRLPAEVMSDAIASVTGVPDEFPGYPVGLRAIQLPEPKIDSYFLSLFGRSERVTACTCERSDEVSLPQLLHLNNGDDIQAKIQSNDGQLAKILKDNPDNEKATDEIFLTAFGRLPIASERDAVQKALSSGDARDDVYRDLMWALMNSKEFSFNH